MTSDSKILKLVRKFVLLAPFLVWGSVFIHTQLPGNQGEFDDNYFFLLFAALVMFVNLFCVLSLLMLGPPMNIKEKFILAISTVLSTPMLFLILALCIKFIGSLLSPF